MSAVGPVDQFLATMENQELGNLLLSKEYNIKLEAGNDFVLIQNTQITFKKLFFEAKETNNIEDLKRLLTLLYKMELGTRTFLHQGFKDKNRAIITGIDSLLKILFTAVECDILDLAVAADMKKCKIP